MSQRWYIWRSNWNNWWKLPLGAIGGEGPSLWLTSWLGAVRGTGYTAKSSLGREGSRVAEQTLLSHPPRTWGLGDSGQATSEVASYRAHVCEWHSVEGPGTQPVQTGWAQAPRGGLPTKGHAAQIPQTGQRMDPDWQRVNQMLSLSTGGAT